MKKRDDETIVNLILKIANDHDNIRAVILNGSRANPGAQKDAFQDFDIIYLVNDVEPFVFNQQWLESFGDLLIMQTPDEIDGHWPKSTASYAFLMQFKDGNRIDLTLVQINQFINKQRDSLSILLLDKDQILAEFSSPSDQDYLPNRITEKEFNHCCNEFFWVSLYVAKGIVRKQLTYAKHMAEHVVKGELIKLLIWYAAIKTHFQKNMGAFGKNLQYYIEPDLWLRFRNTYVDADEQHMWEGLFLMCDIFNELAIKISNDYAFYYDENQSRAIIDYLKSIQKNSTKHSF